MNPARLSLELLCHGLRLDAGSGADARATVLRRTRAGLGSGLEIAIPGARKTHRLNVPVDEQFAQASPWLLRTGADGYRVCDTRDGTEHAIDLVADPEWYDERTPAGTLLSDVGVLQGTYLGIYVGDVCAFWSGSGSSACGFCTTGRNVGHDEALQKSVDDVVHTARVAKERSGVTFVHLNTGYAGPDTVSVMHRYVRALKEEVGVLVGVQATPAADLAAYDTLRDLGVDHVSFCYEFHDPEVLEHWCPGKARAIGQDAYLDAIEHCAGVFGRGAVSGEIIAGVEPIETTLRAIDWIASVGAFPTVCVFRPTRGARMESLPSPDPDEMEVVFREVWNACRRHRVPVGLAPGIEVSLVLTPDDCADLIEKPPLGDRLWRAALAVGRIAAAPAFRRRMRPRNSSTRNSSTRNSSAQSSSTRRTD